MANLKKRHQSSCYSTCIKLTIIFLMVMVPVLGRFEDSSVYGSQRNQVREQRLQPSWRWRNRNREKNKRNNLDLGVDADSNSRRALYFRNDLTNSVQLETIDSCCPTVNEMIQPIAGRNGTGHMVHLYQDDQVRQQFYEVSCHPQIVNKPCKFLERRLVKTSQCIQQHSMTYALVRHDHAHSRIHQSSDSQPSWRLDYIRIRSGCTCQVINRRTTRKAGRRYGKREY